VVVESSSEEEEEEEEEYSSECDAKEMVLFMRNFKKYMNKKFNTKLTIKIICYNCGKHGHFIANCPFERRVTMAIKGISCSSKSLFPNLNQGKHTCLMAKESKHKIKTKGSSSPKYVSSDDDDAPLHHGMNEKATIKRLGKELVLWDQLLELQEDLLEQERIKRLLKLEKEKNEKLAQGKETISSLNSSSGAFLDSYDVLQKTHKNLEVQFDALWISTSKPSSIPKTTKASTNNGCERCYNVNINALCAQSQHSNIEQVLVESCDEAISKENDDLKLEVKRLKQKVSMLEKQAKAQPSQDNRRNMVNKLEKGRTAPKLAPQQQTKPTHHKKKERANIDEKIEYARSSSSSLKGTFTKRSKASITLTMFLMLMLLMFFICLIMNLMHSMFL
jgi:hypothetical protein